MIFIVIATNESGDHWAIGPYAGKHLAEQAAMELADKFPWVEYEATEMLQPEAYA